MSISQNDAKHVAKLARLALNETEITKYTEQLNAILDYAKSLQELNTDHIEPTYHSLAVKTVLREDKVSEFQNKNKLIENGPLTNGTSFVVPRII